MKTMKVYLAMAAVAVALAAQAADDQLTQKFTGNEFSIESFGTVTTDLVNEEASYGFGVSYYVTSSLGARVRTSFDELSGHTFENVSAHGLWRIPIGRHALYAFAGGTREFRGDTGWSIQFGPGYAFRPFNNGLTLSAEIGMTKRINDSQEPPEATATVGIGYAF